MALPHDQRAVAAGDEFLETLGLLTLGHHAMVLRALVSGATALPDIRAAVTRAVDEPSLIAVLKQLMSCGAIARCVDAGPPLRVEYRLTDAGLTLDDLMTRMREWTERWANE